jgi:asparagine synthase (glutamine-hydrolysing)
MALPPGCLPAACGASYHGLRLMCGIAGYVRIGGEATAGDALLEAMAQRVRHRGPDDEGFYGNAAGEVGLAHRRLSIIDLTAAGHQPMSNEDGSLWLVFNGEIYNYRELDEVLRAKGHRYRSHSDSETILNAYREWGDACVERFNGMFAFAIWDERRKRLFCARDRFGEKPFYYTIAAARQLFLFASEIKSLFAEPSVARVPDRRVLHRYLVSGHVDADEDSFFEGIQILPAAHTLVVQDGRVSVARYWSLPEESQQETRADETWAEELNALLTDSVRLRLRSDVPVGTCLSGGLDSSSIICLMSRIVRAPVAAFSVVYDDEGFSESAYVQAMHQALPLEGYVVRPTGADLIDTLQKIVWHNDEPSNGHGHYSQWHVMELASRHGVKVLLNGQGGDELLAGYLRYIPTYARQLALSGHLGRAIRELRGDARLHGNPVRVGAKQMLYPLVPRWLRRVSAELGANRAFLPSQFVSSALAGDFEHAEVRADFRRLRDHLVHDLTVTSVPALVHTEDRSSMAFSREIRLPFLDHRLAEFMFRVPARMKLRDGVTKHILRMAMAGEALPAMVRDRHDKKGYPTPVGRWLRTTASEDAREILASPEFARRGFVDADRALTALRLHREGRADWSGLLWRWLSVEIWARHFLDSGAPSVARVA